MLDGGLESRREVKNQRSLFSFHPASLTEKRVETLLADGRRSLHW